MKKNDSIDRLIAGSRRYGADPAFVLAGGGNTSFKDSKTLWVKASGHALATIGADGFVELDRRALEAMLIANWPADPKEREALFIKQVMASRLHPELNQRPSVEALLHHLLPDRFVIHTHPGIVNALTCCVDGSELAAKLFGDEVLWQEYVDPGVFLAQTLQRSIKLRQQRTGNSPTTILLANHGLIVCGDSIEAIEAVSQRTVATIAAHLATTKPTVWSDGVYSPGAELLGIYAHAVSRSMPQLAVTIDDSPAIARLCGGRGGRDVALAGPLTPDQIVYCRSIPLWIEEPSSDPAKAERQITDAFKEYVKANGFEPWIGLIAGVGLIAFRESAKLAEISRSIYVDAASTYFNALRLGGVRVMTLRDRLFIEQWEVEAFRRAVMSK